MYVRRRGGQPIGFLLVFPGGNVSSSIYNLVSSIDINMPILMFLDHPIYSAQRVCSCLPPPSTMNPHPCTHC